MSEDHWNQVYSTKDPDNVSWYAPHLGRSLELIAQAEVPKSARIIDIGGGASTLPADLLADGYSNITVLDIAKEALETARINLGDQAANIEWLVGNVTTVPLPEAGYDLWHDRAVFHFLTDPADREAYLRQVARALAPEGRIIVATFGPEGPQKCSGLQVARYDDEQLQAQFGTRFERIRCLTDSHTTPWGSEQEFVYCLCRRAG